MAAVPVAVALIESRGRYLVCRRRRGGDFAGYWEFPGGKRRPGEPWARCVRREILEELGVKLRRVRADGRFRHDYAHRSVYFRVFRCRLAPGARPKPLSASALQWASPRTLRRLRLPPANRRLVERLAGRGPGWGGGTVGSGSVTTCDAPNRSAGPTEAGLARLRGLARPRPLTRGTPWPLAPLRRSARRTSCPRPKTCS